MDTAAHGLVLASHLRGSASSEEPMWWEMTKRHQLFIVLLNGSGPWMQNILGWWNAHTWEVVHILMSTREVTPSFGWQVTIPVLEEQQLQCLALFQNDPQAITGGGGCTCDCLCSSAFVPEGFKSLYEDGCYTLVLWWFCEKTCSRYSQHYVR